MSMVTNVTLAHEGDYTRVLSYTRDIDSHYNHLLWIFN